MPSPRHMMPAGVTSYWGLGGKHFPLLFTDTHDWQVLLSVDVTVQV